MQKRPCIGILREVKNKWERRVPLTPSDVEILVKQGIQVLVQPSTKRIFTDQEFRKAGAVVTEDLTPASTIFGVKEFPAHQLIPNRSYVIFSHTIKAQSSNMPFLDACIKNNVRLFDYECIRQTKEAGGQRLVAFGQYAGIAGMIDTFRGVGERLLSLGFMSPFMGVASSYMYPSVSSAEEAVQRMGKEIARVGYPDALAPLRFVFTGTGNVARGALEVFSLLPHKMVAPEELPHVPRDPNIVYGSVVTAQHMVAPLDPLAAFNKQDYYANPHKYRPVFHERVAPHTNVLVNGMYWDPRFPRLLTIEQLKRLEERDQAMGKYPRSLLAIGDISCDIQGSVEFLKRSSTLDAPYYLYDSRTDTTHDGIDGDGVLMMGVDNLPAEFPREASSHFSRNLMPFVPALAQSDHARPFTEHSHLPPEVRYACITADGGLTASFGYIDKLRASREREKEQEKQAAATASLNASGSVPGGVASSIMLEGHLFDSGYINQALDLVEHLGDNFQVVHWDISANRKDRSTNLSRAVVQVHAASAERMADIVSRLHMLAKVVPAAAARVTVLPNDPTPSKPLQIDIAATAQPAAQKKAEAPAPAPAAEKPSKSAVRLTGRSVLVLGAGFVAGPMVRYLSRHGVRLTIASAVLDEARRLAQLVEQDGGSAEAQRLDVDADAEGLLQLISAHDVTVSLLPATKHVAVAKLCLRAKKHLVTASYVSQAMRELDGAAQEAGIVMLNEIGLDPGIDHMSAMRVIDHVKAAGGRIATFESLCGGLPAPDCADNPLMYKFSWSPMGVLNAARNAAKWLENGHEVKVPGEALLSSARPFRHSALSLEQLPNRDSTHYAPLYGLDTAKTVYRATLRYRGFSSVMDALSRLGFLNPTASTGPKPANWAQQSALLLGVPLTGATDIKRELRRAFTEQLMASRRPTPLSTSALYQAREAAEWLGLFDSSAPVAGAQEDSVAARLCEVLKQKLSYKAGEKDMVLLFHRFGVEWADGRKEVRTSSLVAYGGEGGVATPSGAHVCAGGGAGGWSAMARTVGIPTAIATQLILDKHLVRPGVLIPTTPDIYNPVLDRLKEEGIECIERTETTESA